MRMKLTVSLAVLLALLLGYSISPKAVVAQDAASPTSPAAGDNDDEHGRATSYKEFDHALRKDPQMAEELKKNPALMNDPGYLAKHPGLQKYMDTHPDMAKAAKSNPDRLLGSVHRSQVKQQRQTREHRHPENTQPK